MFVNTFASDTFKFIVRPCHVYVCALTVLVHKIPAVFALFTAAFIKCIHFFKYCFSFSIRLRRCGSLWSGCWLYRWCHCRVRLFCIRLHICIRYNRFPVNCRAGIVCSAIYLVVYHISFINVKVCHSI